MITEDYVSFETAKLLKEKGFDEPVKVFWNKNGSFDDNCYVTRNSYTIYYAAPTLQMTMKWLREVHKLEVGITFGFPFIDGKQVYKYFWCPVRVGKDGLEYPMDDPNTAEFTEGKADTYEEACEECIKYCLEILI